MLRRNPRLGLGLALVLATSIVVPTSVLGEECDDGIEILILQLNDVYEIAPLGRGAVGGLARVATIREGLERRQPGRVITVMAGDFLSPSALGDAKIRGEAIAGRQMVAVLNAMGLDYATFGNHEFDYHNSAPLYRAIRESEFRWIGSNVTLKAPHDFPDDRLVSTQIHEIKLPGREEPFRVGFFGVTFYPGGEKYPKDAPLESGELDGYATFRQPIPAARQAVESLKSQKADLIVALTHLNLQRDPEEKDDPFRTSDLELAAEVKPIDLILGGHEHSNNFRIVMDDRTLPPIFKADSNAKTVYVHHLRLRYDPKAPQAAPTLERIDSELVPVTEATDPEPDTDAVVEFWRARGLRAIRESLGGKDPLAPIGRAERSLNGIEHDVRSGPTNLTSLVAEAMGRAARSKEKDGAPGPRYAIFNSGTVRLDDVIPAGPVDTYDVIRILPFGGDIYVARMPGKLLQEFIRRGTACELRGKGGFIQAFDLAGAPRADGTLPLPKSEDLEEDELYSVVFNGFLVSERNSDPVNLNTKVGTNDAGPPVADPEQSFAQASGIDPKALVSVGDLRDAVIAEFAARGPANETDRLADGRRSGAEGVTIVQAPAAPAISTYKVEARLTGEAGAELRAKAEAELRGKLKADLDASAALNGNLNVTLTNLPASAEWRGFVQGLGLAGLGILCLGVSSLLPYRPRGEAAHEDYLGGSALARVRVRWARAIGMSLEETIRLALLAFAVGILVYAALRVLLPQ
jgi:5'-nucleotidase